MLCIFFNFISKSGGTIEYEVTIESPTTLLAPNHPYHYPKKLHCVWHFSAVEGRTFVIKFLLFTIFKEKEGDYLTIGKGQDVSEENALHQIFLWVPSNFAAVLEESSMWLEFHTDNVGGAAAFELQIQRVLDEGKRKLSQK